MSDIIIITIADEDYVESWFSDSQSSKDNASQTFAVRSKTDKSTFTNKMHFLDVYVNRHQLENAVRVKQERKARTQSRKRDKIKINRHKKSHSASRLRSSYGLKSIILPFVWFSVFQIELVCVLV